jgi:hypothetical protein
VVRRAELSSVGPEEQFLEAIALRAALMASVLRMASGSVTTFPDIAQRWRSALPKFLSPSGADTN